MASSDRPRTPRSARWLAIAFSLIFTAALAAPPPAAGHHGRELLLSLTADLPHPGEVYVAAGASRVEAESGDAVTEVEPAVLVGLGRRWAAEVHGHLAREEGGDFEYESTAPALHLLLTPPGRSWGVALSAEYELAHGSHGHGEEEGQEEHDDGEEEHGEEDDHHGGEDRAIVRLAVSGRMGGFLAAVNLVASEEQTSGADVEWGYTAGVRRALSPAWALGLEVQGDLDHSDQRDGHEALVGLYYQPSDRWTVDLGVGTGLGDEGADTTVRALVVWKVR